LRILFINISDIIGGAAIVGLRLSRILEKNYGTENYFIVRTKNSDLPNVFSTRKNKFEEVTERWSNIFFNILGIQYKMLPFSPAFILKKTEELKPDVISLHNIIGGYFTTGLLVKLSRIAPIIWTLHDMWAVTANAAHTFGDESWRELKSGKGEKKVFPTIGINTGRWLIKSKKKIYENSDLTFVTPSNWLYEIVKASPLTGQKKIYCIHNGVDLNVFKPQGKSKIRDELSIPEDEKIITYIAEKFKNNPFKGGKDLIRILKNIDEMVAEKLHLIVIGKDFFSENYGYKNIVLHYFDYVTNEERLSELLSAADLYIYPTRADTLPNVLIEAIACGTPCITFDVGGCSEIIKNDVSGYLSPIEDIEFFCKKTVEMLNNKEYLSKLSKSCRLLAEKNFSIDNMAEGYYSIFKEALIKKKSYNN
jgi:glycosyltransferase involved in cell wall biosynthesis